MSKSHASEGGIKIICANRKARFEYEIDDTYEAGLVLKGSEVKSLRESKVQLTDAWASVDGDEAWLNGLHIAPYTLAQAHSGHEPVRRRKLLLHRGEIDRIRMRMQVERLALVPLSLYFKDGRVKVELALGKGKNVVDKRQDIAKRDADREAAREISRARRGD